MLYTGIPSNVFLYRSLISEPAILADVGMYRSLTIIQNELVDSRCIVIPCLSQINIPSLSPCLSQINSPSLRRSRYSSSTSLECDPDVSCRVKTSDSTESEPHNFFVSTILVPRFRLEELESIERKFLSLIADGLMDYIRNENLNLESLKTSPSDSDDDTES